jgi:hypothetical protein
MKVVVSQQMIIHFSMEMGTLYNEFVTVLFAYKEIISTFKRTGSISGRISCIKLRGRWCDVIVLNVNAPTHKSNDTKENF